MTSSFDINVNNPDSDSKMPILQIFQSEELIAKPDYFKKRLEDSSKIQSKEGSQKPAENSQGQFQQHFDVNNFYRQQQNDQ